MTYPILVKPSFFLKIQAGRTKSGFPNPLRGCLSIFIEYLCNHNENKKFQKLHFNFNYCKLLALAGCFTSFNWKSQEYTKSVWLLLLRMHKRYIIIKLLIILGINCSSAEKFGLLINDHCIRLFFWNWLERTRQYWSSMPTSLPNANCTCESFWRLSLFCF